VEVHWYGGRDGYRLAGTGGTESGTGGSGGSRTSDIAATVVDAGPDRVVLEHDGLRHAFDVRFDGDGAVDVESALGHVALRRTPRFVDPADQVATGSLLAPMPGTVVSVAVAPGDHVTAGQPVLVLEAMKMQHTVAAPHDGVVTEIDVSTGTQVAAGSVLAVVQERDAEAEVSRRSQARSSTTESEGETS